MVKTTSTKLIYILKCYVQMQKYDATAPTSGSAAFAALPHTFHLYDAARTGGPSQHLQTAPPTTHIGTNKNADTYNINSEYREYMDP